MESTPPVATIHGLRPSCSRARSTCGGRARRCARAPSAGRRRATRPRAAALAPRGARSSGGSRRARRDPGEPALQLQ
jgi:hypothetical protein